MSNTPSNGAAYVAADGKTCPHCASSDVRTTTRPPSVHADGTPVVANRPFARLLGYDSPAELQRIASTFGIFGGPAELDRLRCTLQSGSPSTLLFRRKDGQREALEVVGAGWAEAGLNVVAVRRDDSAALPRVTTRSA